MYPVVLTNCKRKEKKVKSLEDYYFSLWLLLPLLLKELASSTEHTFKVHDEVIQELVQECSI